MVTFLKMVGAVLVALVILILLILVWIRWKIRKFLSVLKEALHAPVPPFRIKLVECEAIGWIHEEAVNEQQAAFLELGFEHVGDYDVEPAGMMLKGFVHPSRGTCGVVYDHPLMGVWCDIARRYPDGSMFTYSTGEYQGMDEPPEKTAKFLPEESLKEVTQRLWDDSPATGAISIRPGEFVENFERAYAETMNWRIERGGPTEAEIRRVAEKDGQDCTPESVQQIQDQWRTQISEFFSERQLSRFRGLSKVSKSTLAGYQDRMIAIHDRMSAEDLLGIVDDYYSPEFGLDPNGLDENDEEDAELLQEHRGQQALLELIRDWCAESSPREAFSRLLDEKEQRTLYSHLGTVDKPIPGDIWLSPEDEYDDDAFDDEDEFNRYDEKYDDVSLS